MSYLIFVWSPAGYELREQDGEPPNVGDEIELDGRSLRITEVGACGEESVDRRAVLAQHLGALVDSEAAHRVGDADADVNANGAVVFGDRSPRRSRSFDLRIGAVGEHEPGGAAGLPRDRLREVVLVPRGRAG